MLLLADVLLRLIQLCALLIICSAFVLLCIAAMRMSGPQLPTQHDPRENLRAQKEQEARDQDILDRATEYYNGITE